jgi:hypothetical protein
VEDRIGGIFTLVPLAIQVVARVRSAEALLRLRIPIQHRTVCVVAGLAGAEVSGDVDGVIEVDCAAFALQLFVAAELEVQKGELLGGTPVRDSIVVPARMGLADACPLVLL